MGEGMINVGAHLSTYEPLQMHFNAHQQVAVQVLDNLDPGSARGAYFGDFPGAMRPKLDWETDYVPRHMSKVV